MLGNTLRTVRWKGSSTYVGVRRKPGICEEAISAALVTWLMISLTNSDLEKKNCGIEAALSELLRGSKTKVHPLYGCGKS